MSRINEVSQKIYEDLKKQIFDGELSHGDWLVETAIAKDREINKIHVSYALQQLAEEGFVEYKKRRGYFVKGISDNDFLEYVKLRQMLEIELIKEYLKKATEEQLEDSVRIIRRKIAFLRSELLDDADEETKHFFKQVQTISKYHQIPRLLTQYQSYIMGIIKTEFIEREDIKETIEVNEMLLSCLQSRDKEKGIKWAKTRQENLVASCYKNMIIKKNKIE
jgi:DNA-binding GntR family transcriptional regulator